jgi:hypothetical protein
VPTITEHNIVQSPAWLPLDGVADAMRFVRLDESAYQAASFLDQRLLAGGYEQAICDSEIVRAAAAKLAPRSHYVFHTGHVGSTLISRLIGAHESFFSLREPAPLRALADGRGVPDLRTLLALFGRTWRSNQRAVIKATSIVSELAETVLATDDHATAILMFTDPLSYLRGILGGPNSRVEARLLAPARRSRLARRLGSESWRPDARSEGEHIAMSWLCEMTALHLAAVRYRSRVHWVNFDAFLQDPTTSLRGIFQALGGSVALNDIEALVRGPLMRQYSKAPEYAYDAALRREVLLSADAEHGAEIRRGMQWLERAATHPLAHAVMELSARPQRLP